MLNTDEKVKTHSKWHELLPKLRFEPSYICIFACCIGLLATLTSIPLEYYDKIEINQWVTVSGRSFDHIYFSMKCAHYIGLLDSLQSPIPNITSGFEWKSAVFIHFKVKFRIEMHTFHAFQVKMRTFYWNQLLSFSLKVFLSKDQWAIPDHWLHIFLKSLQTVGLY